MSKIEIKQGSSVDLEVDAIVNAANKYLAPGGGVCGEIFKRAGLQELTNACSAIKAPLEDGSAVITPSFNINTCKYIIHAVGPNFSINKDAYNELFNAYYNSLIVLKNNNLHSISFPLISAGIYSGTLEKPALVSAKECLKAYNRFIEEYDYDIEVYLSAYSAKDYQAIKVL